MSKIEDYEIVVEGAPEPVGAYPHARRYGGLIFISGMGPRHMAEKSIPGVTLDDNGNIIDYDVAIQTQAVVDNLAIILKQEGLGLEHILDIQVFLTNMKDDFKSFNEVYAKNFATHRPTRTTIEVGSLPTPIAVELKVIARAETTS